MENSNDLEKLVFFEVDQNRWSDFEKLFESRGGPKNCWCMVWRGKPEDRENKENKKSAIRKMVRSQHRGKSTPCNAFNAELKQTLSFI
jgi:hypothetical protein